MSAPINDDPPLIGRVALVTGGGVSPGRVPSVGEATARLMARRGASVAVLDVSEEAANASVERIRSDGGEAIAIIADATRESDCRSACARVIEQLGRLDILVNNIGTGDGQPVALVEEDAWDRQFAINLKSALFMTKYALQHMASGSAIANVSTSAVTTPATAASYSASKGALEALTRHTAFQHGPDGVRCNAVRLGEIWTAMVDRHCADDGAADRLREQRASRSALRQVGDAWSAAEAILFLVSPASGFITGQVLAVDGGADLLRPNGDWTAHHSYWKAQR